MIGRGALGKVAINATWLGLGEGFVKAALFLSAALVARSSGAAGLGTFSIAYAAALITVISLASGQQEVLIREVASHPEAASKLLWKAQSIQKRTGILILPPALLAIMTLTTGDLRLCLLSFLPYAILRSITVLYGATFKGLDKMDIEVRARTYEMLVVLICLLGALLLKLPIWTTGLVFSLGSGLGLLWIHRRSLKLPNSQGDPPLGLRELRIEGWPFLAMAILSQLLMRADTFLLAALDISRREIGYYAAAGAPVWGALVLPHLLAMAIYPSLSREAGDGLRPRRTALSSLAVSTLLGTLLAACLFLFRAPLIRLAFGAGFEPAEALLARLVWVLPPAVGMVFLGTILASWRRQGVSLAVLTFLFLLSLVLNLKLIPQHGAMGSATAALISQYFGFVFLSGAALRLSRKPEGIK